jgi:hypothetical protein
VENVAPVQLGIRLLIPEGSRILELEDVRNTVGAFDAESLVYPWKNPDARMDELSEKVQSVAAAADSAKWPRAKTFEAIWKTVHAIAGGPTPNLPLSASKPVPFLSEPWYCCAEPTKDQLVSLGVAASTAKPVLAPVSGESFV